MRKAFLVSFIAIFAVLALITSAIAVDVVTNVSVKVNDMDVSTGNVAVEAGEVVPVNVYFTAGADASDVEVSAWIQGHRSDAVSDDFKDLLVDKEYHARLSLRMPTDLDETEEELTLYVRVETDEGNVEKFYTLNVQRESYNANVLFVEVDNTVEAGASVPVDIVIKNLGRHELDDLIVSVSVPELGVEKRAYFGDLTPTDNEDVFGEDATDAVERRLYLQIPVKAKSGIYELVVKASNDDVSESVKKAITVAGAEGASKVLVPVTSKEIAYGAEMTYSLVIVNSGSKIGVYEIIPETAEGVIVTVENPIVTVKAGESQAVDIKVKALNKEGTFSFAVNVNSGNELVSRAVFNANVVKGKTSLPKGNLTLLTIILAIIFIVLLVVLVVLLTRKPQKEELEESYY